jgi:hypothetical protein
LHYGHDEWRDEDEAYREEEEESGTDDEWKQGIERMQEDVWLQAKLVEKRMHDLARRHDSQTLSLIFAQLLPVTGANGVMGLLRRASAELILRRPLGREGESGVIW